MRRREPNGPDAGTAFFGGPKPTGPFHGMQAEYVRVPFANVGPVKLPDAVTDDQAILLSDIFPTGYFGADLADIKPGSTVEISEFPCIAKPRFQNLAGAWMPNRETSETVSPGCTRCRQGFVTSTRLEVKSAERTRARQLAI